MRVMNRVVVAITFVALLMAVSVAAQALKFGAAVNVEKATPVSELYASPDTFVGKTVRIDGIVTSVCTEMGCWVAVKDAKTDHTVRFQAEHDGKIAFPITLKGKSGSFQGEFVKIGANDHEAREAAAEHAHAEPNAADFGNRYQIKVTGAEVADKQ